jgi:type IV pilus assembly protein PilF
MPHLLGALLLSCLMSSCVTTTGGFNVEVSEEQALEDYLQLAIAYYDADDLTGARRHVNNALDIDARSPDAYTMLALILQREGDLDLAEENFQRAINLDRNNSRARNNYAVLLFSMERYGDAYDQLEQVSGGANYEGRSFAFENLGRAALRLDRNQAAERAFVRALQLNANLYISALELALLRFENQDFNGAHEVYQQYLTTVDFFNIPHTPRALLTGIQIEGHFQNTELVDNFSLILPTLYQDSPEYETYQRIRDAN